MALPHRLPVRPSPARLTFITDDMFKANPRLTSSFTPGEDFGRTVPGLMRGEGTPDMGNVGERFFRQTNTGLRGGVVRGDMSELDELVDGLGAFKSSDLYDDLIKKLPSNVSLETAMEMSSAREMMAARVMALKAEIQMGLDIMPKSAQGQAKEVMGELDDVFDELMGAFRSSQGLIQGHLAKGIDGNVSDFKRFGLGLKSEEQVLGREILQNPNVYKGPTPDNPDIGDLL
jgi:hypothetical protein